MRIGVGMPGSLHQLVCVDRCKALRADCFHRWTCDPRECVIGIRDRILPTRADETHAKKTLIKMLFRDIDDVLIRRNPVTTAYFADLWPRHRLTANENSSPTSPTWLQQFVNCSNVNRIGHLRRAAYAGDATATELFDVLTASLFANSLAR